VTLQKNFTTLRLLLKKQLMSLFPLTHLGKLQLIAMAMAKQQAGINQKKKKKVR